MPTMESVFTDMSRRVSSGVEPQLVAVWIKDYGHAVVDWCGHSTGKARVATG
jgi:hypothetical protein